MKHVIVAIIELIDFLLTQELLCDLDTTLNDSKSQVIFKQESCSVLVSAPNPIEFDRFDVDKALNRIK